MCSKYYDFWSRLSAHCCLSKLRPSLPLVSWSISGGAIFLACVFVFVACLDLFAFPWMFVFTLVCVLFVGATVDYILFLFWKWSWCQILSDNRVINSCCDLAERHNRPHVGPCPVTCCLLRLAISQFQTAPTSFNFCSCALFLYGWKNMTQQLGGHEVSQILHWSAPSWFLKRAE